MKKLLLFWLAVIMPGLPAFAQTGPHQVPKAVNVVGEKAEDVIDLFLKKDWAAARYLVDQIARQEAEVVQDMRNHKMLASSEDLFGFFIFQLQRLSAEKKQPIQAAFAANQITALMIDLQMHYELHIPAEIARMDYLGREVVLLSQVPKNYGLLKNRIDQLTAAWAKLKPDVQTREAPRGTEVASRVSAVVAALQKGGTDAQMREEGRHILDLVDKLEAIYK